MNNFNVDNPTIVVIAFNRIDSIKRLLNSLANSSYIHSVKLVVSIDNGDNRDVYNYATNFIWEHGEKEVIYQEKNLGLKKHILKCGDLTKKYGSIILLEDDLYVSPYFYDYSKQAIEYYQDDDNISQISLYKYPMNNNTKDCFLQMEDCSDNFFMKVASSWGQIWTHKQWKSFREWFNKNDLSITKEDPLPDFVIKWKETSWLKYFIKYNQENNKFVVYPRVSLTSNFSDAGTNNVLDEIYLYQQPLLIEKKEFNFKKLNESICVYDSYYEIDNSVSHDFFEQYTDISFDLYGTKKLHKIKSKYLVSTKICKSPIETYSLSLKPHEMNVLNKLEGNDLNFGLTTDFLEKEMPNIYKKRFKYYWTHTPMYIDLVLLLLHRTSHKYTNLKKKIFK